MPVEDSNCKKNNMISSLRRWSLLWKAIKPGKGDQEHWATILNGTIKNMSFARIFFNSIHAQGGLELKILRSRDTCLLTEPARSPENVSFEERLKAKEKWSPVATVRRASEEEEIIQRPWGRSWTQVCKEQQRSQCGWNRRSEGESTGRWGQRNHKVTRLWRGSTRLCENQKKDTSLKTRSGGQTGELPLSPIADPNRKRILCIPSRQKLTSWQ